MTDTAKFRALAERYAKDDAREDLNAQEWGEAMPPWDVVALLDEIERLRTECHGRRFDPNLVAQLALMTAARDQLADIAEAPLSVPQHVRTAIASLRKVGTP